MSTALATMVEGNEQRPDVEMTLELIDPDTARRYLTRHTRNRSLRRQQVSSYADAMTDGEFLFDAMPVRFDWDERLIDGQHRLHAVVSSGVAAWFLVVRGLDPATQLVMDSGRKRTFGDFLQMRGEANANLLAGAVTCYQAYVKTGVPVTFGRGAMPKGASIPRPSRAELLRCLENNPQIRESVRMATGQRRLVTPSLAAALHYIFCGAASTADADAFFADLHSGAALAATDPVLVLRERLLRERERGHTSGHPVAPALIAALTIRAWNAYIRGEGITKLQYKVGGVGRSAFPKVEQS